MIKCPKCMKANVMRKGLLHSGAVMLQMVSANKPKGKSSPVSAEYCNNCGYIESLYVSEPKILE